MSREELINVNFRELQNDELMDYVETLKNELTDCEKDRKLVNKWWQDSIEDKNLLQAKLDALKKIVSVI